jgi:hypothetical protein
VGVVVHWWVWTSLQRWMQMPIIDELKQEMKEDGVVKKRVGRRVEMEVFV